MDRTVSRRSEPSSRTAFMGEQPNPKTDFRPCSTCRSHSQASLCLYTLDTISTRSEETFVRLRYRLGGDRPSQTAHLKLFFHQIMVKS